MAKKLSFTKFLGVIVAAITIITATTASAQKEVGIAAVVNDSAISTVDLQNRLKIAMFASNLPRGKGFEEKLLPQILRGLIDEKLYMKEAASMNIEVAPDEIQRIVSDIEKRNNIQPGKFGEFLRQNGLSESAMKDQVTSQIMWNKIISKKIRPQISVSDKEIDEKIEHISKQAGFEEVNISEILLTVDSAKDDKKTKDVAEKLVTQLRQDGDFTKVAKQFSKAATAEKGGDVGWVRVGQLPDTVVAAIKDMRAGETSNPIRIPEGYTIIRMNERRALLNTLREDSAISLKRAMVRVPSSAGEDGLKEAAENIHKQSLSVKSCEDFDKFAKDIGSAIAPQKISTKLSELSPEIARTASNLKIGEVSPPIPSDKGLNIIVVCSRDEGTPELALNNKIRDSLMMKKLEAQANNHLRELRRGAFIEVRI